MSFQIRVNSQTINGKKSQKDIILEKIHRIKSYNSNLINEYIPTKKKNKNKNKKNNNSLISPFYSKSKNVVNNSNQNTLFKKVFMKPLVKTNRIYITKKKYLTNNCTLNKNLNYKKIKELNNDKLDSNNNIIANINLRNKTLVNNENSLNETTSDYDIEKLGKFKINNTINNNLDNNILDDFYTVEKEKKNKIINLKNNHERKKSNEINRICLKNNNNININILEKDNTSKGNESININSFNLISNDNVQKINNPLYLSKLFSFYNTINENDTIRNINKGIVRIKQNLRNKKIKKKMKKKFFINEINNDINKANEENQIDSNYYSSITEVNPNFRIAEIEITKLNLNKNNNKNEKINILESKRKILNSIEKEKQKIIDESIKNYRKYLYLIQKQQQEYEEYDKYLKKELNNNHNNKLKLQLFKDKLKLGSNNTSNLNVLKNKNSIFYKIESSPPKSDNKTFSSKNLNKKNRNNITNKNILTDKNNFNEKKLLATSDGCKPLLNEAESNFNHNLKLNNNERKDKPINKNILKINIEEIRNKKKKYNLNNIKYINKFKKTISNVKINYFSLDTLKKANPKIKLESFNHQQIKNEKESDNNKNKNKLNLNNIRKRLILKKLIKDIKTVKEKKKSKQIYKKSISNLSSPKIKCNSFKKLEKGKEYYNKNILINTPFEKIQDIHRMITEEKNKAVNKLKLNTSKFKEKKNILNNDYYSEIKTNQLKENNIINLNEKFNTEFYRIKNGLYYSSFKTNKSEDNN